MSVLIKINHQHSLNKAQKAIMDKLNQPKDGKTLYVSIFWADDDKLRSLNQNRIYWQYLTNISQHTGISKDSLHKDFKRQFLAKILARDDKAYRACFDSIKHAKAYLSDSEYQQLAMGVASLISTTKANVKQMGEYLNDIENWYLDNFDANFDVN